MKQKAPVFDSVQTILDRLEDYSLPPEQYLDRNFGHGSWTYDPCSAVWIVVDDLHSGPGRGYLILDQQLRRQEMVVAVH
jgi:hypothetical protein